MENFEQLEAADTRHPAGMPVASIAPEVSAVSQPILTSATDIRKIDARDIKILPVNACAEPVPVLQREDIAFWQQFGAQIMPLNPDPVLLVGDLQAHFAQNADDGLGMRLPATVIAIGAETAEANDAVAAICQKVPKGPPFPFTVKGRSFFMYRCEGIEELPESFAFPAGVMMWRAGQVVPLPVGDDFSPEDYRINSVNDLPALTIADLLATTKPAPEQIVQHNPLAEFSLRGQAEKFEAIAVDTRPLLGEVCQTGQATIWYAPPNAGKTLITLKLLLDAIDSGRLIAGNTFYINADDSSSGFAKKIRLLDDVGVHTLCPGQRGFNAPDLAPLLLRMASESKARGVVVIVDTVKKFVDLMNKKECSTFADACRRFVMKGGTMLCLSHTNKNPTASGKLKYAGTADLVQDLDAGYVITPLPGDAGETVAQFVSEKNRGGGAESVAYSYANDRAISYEERLASVRLVDPEQLGQFQKQSVKRSDEELINAIRASILAGIVKKMALSKAAAAKAGSSQREAIRVLERYTGSEPEQHHWTYAVREQGAKIFELLAPAVQEPMALAA